MWNTLTNAELWRAINRIVNACTNVDEVNRRAENELGYPYHIVATYSERNSNGQCMSMFRAFAKDGTVLK